VTVTAVLQSNPAESGSSTVTIDSPSGIQGSLQIAPHLSSVTTSQTQQFQIHTTGVSNSDVSWSVDGVSNGNAATGTILSGLYSPPNAAGGHLITATLKSNPSVVGTAQVEVTDFAGTFTWRNDNSRSGQNTKERALAPTTISPSTFGKLFSCPLDGQAYAQPLYVANLDMSAAGDGTRNVVFVATEKDGVYAFDADAQPCVQLWHRNLVPAGEQAVATPNLQITSADISPFVGITGTPVIDPLSSTLYVVAKTETTSVNPVYHQRLYALELATGQPKIQPGGVDITTPVSVSPAFSATLENQRAALLLDHQIVYVAFGSYQDLGDYHGWVLGYDSSTLQQVFVLDDTPGGTQGGIWQSGGGPSADASRDVFVTTGNGTFDADRGGQDYGDSFLRLIDAGGGSIADYFTPCDQSTLSSSGEDLGASATLLLPDSAGSAEAPNLVLGGGKNGSLYLLNRDNLGGYNGVCPDSTTRVQTVPVGDGPIFGTPLFWNGLVYVAAGNGNLKAFSLSNGLLGHSPLASQSPETLGPLGATPVLSSSGADNAVLWLIDASDALASPNAPAVLRAFDPANLSIELYNSAMNPSRDTAGLAVKFTLPTVANGKVYVGTQTELDVYGLLPQ
jgi:PQQ-like domain